MTRYHRAPCGSLIRDTGADDLARHEASCPVCVRGYSVWDRPESEDDRLNDVRHGQAEGLNQERYKP